MSAGLLEGRRAGCHRSVFQNQLDTSCDPGIGQFGAVMPKSGDFGAESRFQPGTPQETNG
jgi:hypothetical protein